MATAKKKDRLKAVSGARALAQQIDKFPASKLWLDYDTEADVLYISLQRPQKATETIEIEEEGILSSIERTSWWASRSWMRRSPADAVSLPTPDCVVFFGRGIIPPAGIRGDFP